MAFSGNVNVQKSGLADVYTSGQPWGILNFCQTIFLVQFVLQDISGICLKFCFILCVCPFLSVHFPIPFM